MRQYEQYLKGSGKNTLFFRAFEPDEHPAMVICLIHGVSDHSGRYSYWASLFAQKNIAVTAIDLRGYGKSTGKCTNISIKHLYNDITTLIFHTANIFQSIPIILYGHGLGGILAVNYFLTKKPEISGMIISSACFKHNYLLPDLKLIIYKPLMYFIPFLSIKNIINPQYLSRNPDIMQNYLNDDLVHNKISVKLYFEALSLGNTVIGKSYLINIPMLLMHGSADKIAVCKSTLTFGRNTGKYTTLKIWENCYHELHNEPNNIEIFDYIFNWLKANFQIV